MGADFINYFVSKYHHWRSQSIHTGFRSDEVPCRWSKYWTSAILEKIWLKSAINDSPNGFSINKRCHPKFKARMLIPNFEKKVYKKNPRYIKNVTIWWICDDNCYIISLLPNKPRYELKLLTDSKNLPIIYFPKHSVVISCHEVYFIKSCICN